MLVLDLFSQLAARLGSHPAVPFLDAVEGISQAITRKLVERGADILKADPTTITINAGEAYSLPETFLGFTSRPYCVSDGVFLAQASEEDKISYTATGLRFYDLRNRKISLIPEQTTAKVLKITFLQKPARITVMSDTLPFDGDFDFIFQETVLQVMDKGIGLTSDPAFQRYLDTKIGELTQHIQPVVKKRNGYFD